MFEIDRFDAGGDVVSGGFLDALGYVCVADDKFRRDAASVRASASEAITLDEGNGFACFGSFLG